jgi:pimeloyl-ACP methyl ester carboxylesterase
LVAGVLMGFCGDSDGRVSVPEDAQAGDLILHDCTAGTRGAGNVDADCGTLVVPENHDARDSRLIALPITRIRATGSDPTEPIFWLQGGPGISNMDFSPFADLVENHDVVLVGYRGIDGYSELDCPEVADAMHGEGSDLLSDDSLAAMADAVERCGVRLQNEGVDLDGYSMPHVIEDMEAARTGLGYERINLISESYGTRLAQIYAWTYPDSLHRSAMIGVNPPGRFVFEPETTDSQFEYYSQLCAEDSGCSDRTSDLAADMRDVAHDLPSRWLIFPIDSGKVRALSQSQMQHREPAAFVMDTFLGNDAGGFWLMSLFWDAIFPEAFTWGAFYSAGMSADFDPSRDYAAELDPPDSILGSPLALLFFTTDWPTEHIPSELRQVQQSDVETLLIGGTVDFATPVEYATDELLPFLTNGRQVILKEFGHSDDVWNEQPEAIERLLTSFYDTGVGDDSLFVDKPMDFGTPVSLGLVAWGFLGGILAIIVVAAVLLFFVIRRVRRRKYGAIGRTIFGGLLPLLLTISLLLIVVLIALAAQGTRAIDIGLVAVVIVVIGAGVGSFLPWVDRESPVNYLGIGLVVSLVGALAGAAAAMASMGEMPAFISGIIGAVLGGNLFLIVLDTVRDVRLLRT